MPNTTEVESDFASRAEKEAQRSLGYKEYTAEERAAIGKYTAKKMDQPRLVDAFPRR